MLLHSLPDRESMRWGEHARRPNSFGPQWKNGKFIARLNFGSHTIVPLRNNEISSEISVRSRMEHRSFVCVSSFRARLYMPVATYSLRVQLLCNRLKQPSHSRIHKFNQVIDSQPDYPRIPWSADGFPFLDKSQQAVFIYWYCRGLQDLAKSLINRISIWKTVAMGCTWEMSSKSVRVMHTGLRKL